MRKILTSLAIVAFLAVSQGCAHQKDDFPYIQ
jgi:hypothetical protein